MNLKRGKSTVLNLILLLVVVYGGFALVKHLGANFQSKQIDLAVKDRIALERGEDFVPAKGEELIREILEREGVIYDEGDETAIEVIIDTERQMIEYYIQYQVDVDFILFKKRRTYEIENELRSYS